MNKEKVKVEYLQKLMDKKNNSLWYGGDVAKIQYKDIEIIISAQGHVECVVYKNGEELERIKDRHNNAILNYTLENGLPNINTDAKLEEILSSELYSKEKIKEIEAEKSTNIILNCGNWWEIFVYKNGEYTDYHYAVDYSDDFNEVLNTTIESVEEIYEYSLEV